MKEQASISSFVLPNPWWSITTKSTMIHDIVTNTLHQILGIFPEPEIPIMIHDDQRNVSGNGEFQIWGQIF